MAGTAMHAQVGARRHAEEMDDFLRDFANWERRMKAKDAELRGNKVSKMDAIPGSPQAKGKEAQPVKKVVKEAKSVSFADEGQGDVLRKRQHADELKDKGNAYFKAQKYEEAIASYTEGMENDPTNALLPANRAMALLKVSQFAEAEQDCGVAIRLDPTYVKAYLRRASARLALKNPSGAEADFSKVLELEPSNKQAADELKKLQSMPKQPSKLVKTTPALVETVVERAIAIGDMVLPVDKPVFQRSKVPLKKIEIKEIGNLPSRKVQLLPSPGDSGKDDSTVISPVEEASKRPETAQKKPPKAVESSRSPMYLEASSVPSEIPKTAQDFIRDWNSMSHRKDWQFEYLKMIDPSKFASIFKDFLTSDVLGEMVSVMHSEASGENKASVFPILEGLTEVPRFDLLAMFLADAQKKDLRKLLAVENCPGVENELRQKVWDAFDL